MKLAAIDIGSNAIRIQVIRVIKQMGKVSFKKLEYIRFPLRLGQDVFKTKVIQEETIRKFEKLMRTFKLFIELYEVDGYMATATSAMREAKNGKEIVSMIATYFDLKIDIISGNEEAEILSKAIIPYLGEHRYVHIDVGGGSTELSLYTGKEKVASRSFRIGSVRQLNSSTRKTTFKQVQKWIDNIKDKLKPPVIALGTGGNINKLYKLSNQKYNNSVSLTELQALRAYVEAFTYEERMNVLKMNPDRADVIIPASEIYIESMKIIGADHIMVPKVGLKDGLIYLLYEKVSGERIEDVEFLEEF